MPDRPRRAVQRIFVPILAGATLSDRLLASVGALAGIALTFLVCAIVVPHVTLAPLLVAPVGASAVLLFAVPASPLAQPWSIVGGNTVSALVGVVVVQLIPWPALAVGVAVSGAIMAMSVLRCLHPPGGAAALTAVIGGHAVTSAGFAFPFVPVALNSLVLVAVGIAFHRYSGHSYPHRPVPVAGHGSSAPLPMPHPDDLTAALDDLGETFDVTREDLELLFRHVALHAANRRARERGGIRGMPSTIAPTPPR